MHLFWTCYGLQHIKRREELAGPSGRERLRDGVGCKCGRVDVWLAYFSLLLLRGTVPFPLWWSSLLSVCLAEWFHMEEHIRAASGTAERGDKQVWSRTRVFTATSHYCIQVLMSAERPAYNCSVSGLCLTCPEMFRSNRGIFFKSKDVFLSSQIL